MAENMISMIPTERLPFCGTPHYSREGDCLFVYLKPVEHYRDRVDARLTLYRSMEGDEIVGYQIKGLSAIRRTEVYKYSFDNPRRVNLTILVVISHLIGDDPTYPENDRRNVYRELAALSRDRFVELPEDCID